MEERKTVSDYRYSNKAEFSQMEVYIDSDGSMYIDIYVPGEGITSFTLPADERPKLAQAIAGERHTVVALPEPTTDRRLTWASDANLDVLEQEHLQWVADIRAEVKRRREQQVDTEQVKAWRSWLRGKGCSTETYCPDAIASELAKAGVRVPGGEG
jgi:hypothetical protein